MDTDNGSLCEGTVNGTWVFKRKRKRNSLSVEASNKKDKTKADALSSLNAANKIVNNNSGPSLTQTIKGHDGVHGKQSSPNLSVGAPNGTSKQLIVAEASDDSISSGEDEKEKKTLPLSHLNLMKDHHIKNSISKLNSAGKQWGEKLDKFLKERKHAKISCSLPSQKAKKKKLKKKESKRSRVKRRRHIEDDSSDDLCLEMAGRYHEEPASVNHIFPDKKRKKLKKISERKYFQEIVESELIKNQEDFQVDRILGCRIQRNKDTHSSSISLEKCCAGPLYSDLHTTCDMPLIVNARQSKESQLTSHHNLGVSVLNTCHAEAGADKNGRLLQETEVQIDGDKSCESNEVSNVAELHVEVMVSPMNKIPGGSGDDLVDAKVDTSVVHSQINPMAAASRNQRNGIDGHRMCVDDATIKESDCIMFEFLVKWVGKSNIHNSWIVESELKILAKRKLENYKAKYGTCLINICNEQWMSPQRVIALRDSVEENAEVLVKWRGLPYDECTWERLDEPVIKSSVHLITQFKQFESATLENDSRDCNASARSDCRELISLNQQPKELQGGLLFPHQLDALNWLRKCWFRSKNVILADEMGLGKTISACAFLSSLYCEFKVKLPCLVLVPLSTMPNWLAEFALWAPHLYVVEYHGSAKARSIIRQYEWHASSPKQSGQRTVSFKFNVLLTTYEMVLADSSHLRSVPWEVLIVDEGHRLKNSSSKLFGLLNSFSFQHRVLLTGTPLQNNIGEMYNLLNFLQPVSFPCLAAFEEKFNHLTTAKKVEELKKLVAPHMLRRLKKEAMQNIPPKTERVVPVELTSIQAEYYRAMLTKNYQVLRNVGKGGAQQSLLNIIMQLRKVCNHPYLIPGTEPESGSYEFLHEMRIKASAKLSLLHSMLRLLHKDGHRVLIFSQMTKLLDILEDYLTVEFGPGTFERVDGSVSVADRQAAITRFNEDKTRFVFLLSTRSCGLGINLATADTVIIYDSDFNPHADIQAMNRAHRIGQSNRLLVYRLFVRGSVEERILQLAKRKLVLDQLFVNKSESLKEVEDIIRWGTEELFSENDLLNKSENKSADDENCTMSNSELKYRKRTSGLGDVYEDKCAGGSATNQWDENAILKLLDRSNLQSAGAGADADQDTDFLGTVKSVDWNDGLNDEPCHDENHPCILPDGSENLSKPSKEDNAGNDVENDWDRLLRARWERSQVEEEAALGRGKRLRKAVSYKENFAAIHSEAVTVSSEEDEPAHDYSSAGRAHKEKYTKLRARQKERVSQRHKTLTSMDDVRTEDFAALSPTNEVQRHNIFQLYMTYFRRSLDEKKTEGPSRLLVRNADDVKLSDSPDSKIWNESGSDVRIRSKQASRKYYEALQNLSAQTFGSSRDLSPVLGLCAPNAEPMHSFRNSQSAPKTKDQCRAMKVSPEESPQSTPISDHITAPVSDGQPISHGLLTHDSAEALERLKNIIPESYFPFKHVPPMLAGDSYGGCSNPVSSFASFQETMKLNTKEILQKPILGVTGIPLPPYFPPNFGDTMKQKHETGGFPAMLGLGEAQAKCSSMPENHKKVLDSIMMRANCGTTKVSRKRQKIDYWTQEELDFLWIGVRRHGKGNWASMLKDPKLKLLSHRTAEELELQWREEQCKILEEPIGKAQKSSNPVAFPGVSVGMVSSLNGSGFVKLRTEPILPSQCPEVNVGYNEGMPGFPYIYLNSVIPKALKTTWHDSNEGSVSVGEPSSGCFGKSDNSGNGLIPSNHFSPFIRESPNFLPSSYLSGSLAQNNDINDCKNLYGARQINLFQLGSFNPVNSLDTFEKDFVSSLDDVPPSRNMPHWLQDALCATLPKYFQSDLPPAISAISLSVHLIFGAEQPVIPPFHIPGPPLQKPEDPRETLKKRDLSKPEVSSKMQQLSETACRGDSDSAIPQTKSASSVVQGDVVHLHMSSSAVSSDAKLRSRGGQPLLLQSGRQQPTFTASAASPTSSKTILERADLTSEDKDAAVGPCGVHFPEATSQVEELGASSDLGAVALTCPETVVPGHIGLPDNSGGECDGQSEDLRHTECLENLEDKQFFLYKRSGSSDPC